jgi:REP element-mobilizing transposase RayT
MTYDSKKHHRRSVRLKGYDYAQPGAYFVTICVRDRKCLLGKIINDQVQKSEYGRVAESFWAQIPVRFPNVSIDVFVVMPNHIHAIVMIHGPTRRGAVTAPLGGVTPPLRQDGALGGVTPPLRQGGASGGVTAPLRRPTLGQVVAYYKYETTKQINQVRGTPGCPFWQRGFYDHVVRNERDLNAVREYVANNPLKWALDRDNPANLGVSAR